MPFDLKFIHSLHALSQLPILVFSADKELIQAYGNKDYLTPYSQLLAQIKLTTDSEITFYEGLLEEIFLIFQVDKYFISIGPFYSHILDDSYREELANRFLKNYTFRDKKELINYMALVPTFCLHKIRNLLITIDSFFQTNFEANYCESINLLLQEIKPILPSLSPETIRELKLENSPSSQLPDTLKHLHKVLKLVELGNIEVLKSENTDVSEKFHSYKQFIKMTEEASNIITVLRIRTTAIITFTELLSNKSISNKEQLYNSILYYVDNHLYSKIRISDIANHFYVSNSHLRSVFKLYSDISLQSYILKRKIQEAQLLLKRGVPVGMVAKDLHFHDTTHLLKTFKKYSGMSPKEFLKHDNIAVKEASPTKKQISKANN
ncbi:helix-turn-helix domain-containing protein [Streptococcus halichoeri]|uniref:helix-turn-helix domain-containing protein n=1 Tax=Streptococcus halichoeri TaxID=254785 RepID=UPI001359E8E3|nr:helix-turn-helix domain-containing protein [Streptococcus halichoeri]